MDWPDVAGVDNGGAARTPSANVDSSHANLLLLYIMLHSHQAAACCWELVKVLCNLPQTIYYIVVQNRARGGRYFDCAGRGLSPGWLIYVEIVRWCSISLYTVVVMAILFVSLCIYYVVGGSVYRHMYS